MSAVLSPIVSEFETQEAADAYDAWFRAKVQKSLDSTNPKRYTNDEVFAHINEVIKKNAETKQK